MLSRRAQQRRLRSSDEGSDDLLEFVDLLDEIFGMLSYKACVRDLCHFIIDIEVGLGSGRPCAWVLIIPGWLGVGVAAAIFGVRVPDVPESGAPPNHTSIELLCLRHCKCSRQVASSASASEASLGMPIVVYSFRYERIVDSTRCSPT